jgi:protein-S-isoprenylcysteine O-methyltransferase Ste14
MVVLVGVIVDNTNNSDWFLIMWPTLLTLIMFPVMVMVYLRLSRLEEKLVRKEFGSDYDVYANRVPAYIPFFKIRSNRNESG